MNKQQGDNKRTLIVFADDWGRHPSSCQHLVRRLFDHYEVIWVNTIGTRRPKFDLYTFKRGIEKVSMWLRPKRQRVEESADITIDRQSPKSD